MNPQKQEDPSPMLKSKSKALSSVHSIVFIDSEESYTSKDPQALTPIIQKPSEQEDTTKRAFEAALKSGDAKTPHNPENNFSKIPALQLEEVLDEGTESESATPVNKVIPLM